MRTHEQIIRDAGGYKALAKTIAPGDEVLGKRARFWEMRKSIPHDQWPAIIAAGIATLDELSPALAEAVAQAPAQGTAA